MRKTSVSAVKNSLTCASGRATRRSPRLAQYFSPCFIIRHPGLEVLIQRPIDIDYKKVSIRVNYRNHPPFKNGKSVDIRYRLKKNIYFSINDAERIRKLFTPTIPEMVRASFAPWRKGGRQEEDIEIDDDKEEETEREEEEKEEEEDEKEEEEQNDDK